MKLHGIKLIEAYREMQRQMELEAEEDEDKELLTTEEEFEGVVPEMATEDDLAAAEEYAAEDVFVAETDIMDDPYQ